MLLEQVRTAISAELTSLGLSDVSDLRETILIRNGLFCGRKFQSQGHQVVWFIEENEIKFFAPDGTLLMATTPQRCLESQTTHAPTQPLVQPAIRRAA